MTILHFNSFKFNVGQSAQHKNFELGTVTKVVDATRRVMAFADYDQNGNLLGEIEREINVDDLLSC